MPDPDDLNDEIFSKLKINNKYDLLPNHTTFGDVGIGFDENIDSIGKYDSKIPKYMDLEDIITTPLTQEIRKMIIDALRILDEVAYRIIGKHKGDTIFKKVKYNSNTKRKRKVFNKRLMKAKLKHKKREIEKREHANAMNQILTNWANSSGYKRVSECKKKLENPRNREMTNQERSGQPQYWNNQQRPCNQSNSFAQITKEAVNTTNDDQRSKMESKESSGQKMDDQLHQHKDHETIKN